MPITAPSRGSIARSRSRRAFRRRSPRVIPFPPLPLPTGRPPSAFGTPSPNYRTRRTFLYQPHHRRTTTPSALSYYYGVWSVSQGGRVLGTLERKPYKRLYEVMGAGLPLDVVVTVHRRPERELVAHVSIPPDA